MTNLTRTSSNTTSWETNDVAYELTATTFKKTSQLPFHDTRLDGTPFTWFRAWNHERITNEARALFLVSEKTQIPVPKIVEHGALSDGRRYLVTEAIDGITLDQFPQPCSNLEREKHTNDTRCKTCSDKAYSNALDFLRHTVFVELSKLRSRVRGISGFVMPPSWLRPLQPPFVGDSVPFKTLPLEHEGYVFQHGDIGAHNIMMDRDTLQVKALIDWEYAGFFPPGMEKWPECLNMDSYRNRANDVATAIEDFLAEEYVERYDQSDDKTLLDKLIEQGELPHPERLRKLC